MKEYTWEMNGEAEIWMNACFNSPKECIADAIQSKEAKIGDLIYIGETDHFEISVDSGTILDHMQEKAYEFAGEAAEGWGPYAGKSKEALQELSDQLTDTVTKWLQKHDDMPGVYRITNIKEVEITEVNHEDKSDSKAL